MDTDLFYQLFDDLDSRAARREGQPVTPKNGLSSPLPTTPGLASQQKPIPQAEGLVFEDEPSHSSSKSPSYGPVDNSITVPMLLGRGYHQHLRAAPTPIVYEALWALRRRRTSPVTIKEFVKHLVEDRGEPMNQTLFEALLVANWDPTGHGADLWKIANVMHEAKIRKNYNIFSSFLQALAIHPNYVLRNLLLREMKMRWVELQPEARSHIALGLLRDKQYELAYDKLEEMIQERIPFPSWVFDIFIYTFTQLGFMNEALAILLQQRSMADGDRPASLNVIYFLLDEGSRAMHYEATKYVWGEMVDNGILNPSDGITLNALNTFSRYGDVELATKAIQHLSSRGVKLGMHHYEALVDCYVLNEDLENALQVLCIMGSAGLRSDKSTTRSIYMLLRKGASYTERAVDALFDLSKTHKVPIAAFNAVIEALCQQGDTGKAVNLYQHVRQICRTGPNPETFEILLSGHPKAEMVDFLLAEMPSFSVNLTHAMRNDMVYSYAQDQSCPIGKAFETLRRIERDAFEIGNHGLWISKPAALVLIERCLKDEDPRVWQVVDSARLRTMDIEEEVRNLSAKWEPANKPAPVAAKAVSQTTA